jgi:hypothetical protein
MIFPENVGYPIGEGTSGQVQYHMLEIHYDNPLEREDVRFKTGVNYYYTEELR